MQAQALQIKNTQLQQWLANLEKQLTEAEQAAAAAQQVCCYSGQLVVFHVQTWHVPYAGVMSQSVPITASA